MDTIYIYIYIHTHIDVDQSTNQSVKRSTWQATRPCTCFLFGRNVFGHLDMLSGISPLLCSPEILLAFPPLFHPCLSHWLRSASKQRPMIAFLYPCGHRRLVLASQFRLVSVGLQRCHLSRTCTSCSPPPAAERPEPRSRKPLEPQTQMPHRASDRKPFALSPEARNPRTSILEPRS